MRESALTQAYRKQAVGLMEYHGWRLPSMFSSPLEEYAAARETAACIDSSFWGRVELGGRDALDLLHRLSTNDLLDLKPGDVRRTVLTSDKGRIVDLLTVVALPDRFLLITSPDCEEQVARWIEKYTVLEDVILRCATDETVMASFHGPQANSVCSFLLGAEASVTSSVIVPWGEVLLIPMQADRQPMIHLVARREKANEFWSWISVATVRWAMMGVRAFELYRIATGMPIAGAELTDQYNPYDVGLMEYVDFRKGCYIGQEVISRIDTYQKVRFGLKGLLLNGLPGPLETGRAIFASDLEAGWMTSCAPDRIRGVYPALGVMRTDITEGTSVRIRGAGEIITGQVVSIPMEWSAA
jgi:folate-binding protein YgfZ